MRLRNLAVRLLLLSLSLAAVWQTASLEGQTRVPAREVASAAELQQVITAGEQLERQGRWGEALLYYEEAARKHPNREDLVERLQVARMHYDVARRYHDQSFVASMDQMDDGEALDLYAEVLLKIQAHYVHQPDWDGLLRKGATAVQVALDEPAFRERHQVAAGDPAVTALIRELNAFRPIRSRHDAREAVRYACHLADERLGLPGAAVILEYTASAAASLDNYSSFLTASQLDEIMSQIEGNFVGLGVELKADNQSLLIVNVIPRGPADDGGIRPGDRIVNVDGFSTTDISTDAAADMLRGREGTSVELIVRSEEGVSRRVVLKRQRVEVPSIENEAILDKQFGIAYLRLASFQKTTSRDVESALWRLHRQGMRSLIVDVRGNPGGLLTASVEVADKFISEGSIVRTVGRSSGENYDYKAHSVGTWRVPLIVLIDGDSASASEIFAGAIRDHRRGTLVGSRSYGKGSVQGIFPLNVSDAGIRLTTAKFYSPMGHAISQRGVRPDIEVRQVAKPAVDRLSAGEQKDLALSAALREARGQFSQR